MMRLLSAVPGQPAQYTRLSDFQSSSWEKRDVQSEILTMLKSLHIPFLYRVQGMDAKTQISFEQGMS